MDIRTFIVQFAGALAWPVVVVALVLSFRKSLLALMTHVSSLRYDKVEFQFAKSVAAVGSAAHEILPAVRTPSMDDEIRADLQVLAMSSPESAIVEVWRYLEGQLLHTATTKRLEIAPAVRTMPMVIAALLLREEALSEAQFSLITRLRQLRQDSTNQKPGSVTIEQAMSYIDASMRLAASLTGPKPAGSTPPARDVQS